MTTSPASMAIDVNHMLRAAGLLVATAVWPGIACALPPEAQAQIVQAHNAVRARIGVPNLAWDPALADSAQRWANFLRDNQGCNMQHSHGSYGENLFWNGPLTWSDGRTELVSVKPEEVVNDWASEQADYTYGNNTCAPGKVCGHYTQVIWRATTTVGCAMSACADKSQVWVCQYQPPGNYVGQRPY